MFAYAPKCILAYRNTRLGLPLFFLVSLFSFCQLLFSFPTVLLVIVCSTILASGNRRFARALLSFLASLFSFCQLLFCFSNLVRSAVYFSWSFYVDFSLA